MAQTVTTKHAPIIKINSHSGMDSSRVVMTPAIEYGKFGHVTYRSNNTRTPTAMLGSMDTMGDVRRMLINHEMLIRRRKPRISE